MSLPRSIPFLLLISSFALHATVPNVVYIIADDQTYRDFGFMGSKDALTPHIDKLASQSARFVNGYVPTSLCSPSLGVLLTGRYPHESGLHYNRACPKGGRFSIGALFASLRRFSSGMMAFSWLLDDLFAAL